VDAVCYWNQVKVHHPIGDGQEVGLSIVHWTIKAAFTMAIPHDREEYGARESGQFWDTNYRLLPAAWIPWFTMGPTVRQNPTEVVVNAPRIGDNLLVLCCFTNLSTILCILKARNFTGNAKNVVGNCVKGRTELVSRTSRTILTPPDRITKAIST